MAGDRRDDTYEQHWRRVRRYIERLIFPVVIVLIIATCSNEPTAPATPQAAIESVQVFECPETAKVLSDCNIRVKKNVKTLTIYRAQVRFRNARLMNVRLRADDQPDRIGVFGPYDRDTVPLSQEFAFGFIQSGRNELFIVLLDRNFNARADTTIVYNAEGNDPPVPTNINELRPSLQPE